MTDDHLLAMLTLLVLSEVRRTVEAQGGAALVMALAREGA